jgi:hypothetical protein
VGCRAAALILLFSSWSTFLVWMYSFVQSQAWTIAAGNSAEFEYGILVVGALLFLPGAALAKWNLVVARWIAPMPEFRCLRCDYDASKLTTDVCPECGASLGIEIDRRTE